MTLQLFDNSRLSDFRGRSARYYYYRHIRGWVKSGASAIALTAGSSWHAAMDQLWSDPDAGWETAWKAFVDYWVVKGEMYPPDSLGPEDLTDLEPYNPWHFQEMLIAYAEQRSEMLKSIELLAVEHPFVVPLDPGNPNLFYIGRMDKIVKRGGRIGGIDHKTTKSYVVRGYPNPTFPGWWKAQWPGHSQMDGYLFNLMHEFKEKRPWMWVDGALVHREQHDQFCLIPIDRRLEMLDMWLWQTHFWVDQIRQHEEVLYDLRAQNKAADLPYMPVFPCDGASCSGFGGCPYSELCKTRANPETWDDEDITQEGYEVSRWEPFDESAIKAALEKV